MSQLGHFFRAAGQTLSRGLNSMCLGGSPHQSTSARAYVESRVTPVRDPVWVRRRVWIDWLFRLGGPDHCKKAWNFEVDNALETLRMNGNIPSE